MFTFFVGADSKHEGQGLERLEVKLVDFNATAAKITVTPKEYPNLDILNGYAIYYKIAPIKNVTRFSGRHGCGFDK